MRVLFASSEVFPLVKTGGLADVSASLPQALAQLGVEPRLILPAYPEARERAGTLRVVARLGDPLGLGESALLEGHLPDSGLPVWLVDCPPLYQRPGGPYQDSQGRDWPDNALRFGLLGWVAARLSQASTPLDWRPEVLHVNDWQTGLALAYLQSWGGPRPGTVATIHNIAYQGLFPADTLPRLGLPWDIYNVDGVEFWSNLSFLKAALVYADALTTVSPTYAREIQTAAHGCGFDGLLAARAATLVGILNGADYRVWDPAGDADLAQRYAPTDRNGKARNKAALQAELGLPGDPAAPLLAIVSRLNDLKGMDLVLAAMPTILRLGCQLAVLGTGEHGLEEGFRAVAANHPGQVAVHLGYDEALAHRIIAGADVLLMPSRAEPCGLTQLYAMRYATIPVVRRAGGLADSVVDTAYDTLMTGHATGFVFDQAAPAALGWCIERAVAAYRNPDQWPRLQANAAAQDFSWRRSAESYRKLYYSVSRG